MTPEELLLIHSNDYADLIIHYGRNESILRLFENATVQLIGFYAIIHVPLSDITNATIRDLGYYVMPDLYGIISEESLASSGITRLRNIPALNLRGEGVLIGILDTGIDYTNPIFRKPDSTTKIAAIWDQTIVSEDLTTNTYYGTEYTREQINLALQSENPLEIVPTTDEIGHGTMLAGIIAGNDVPENNFYGVVPDAELVVVKLKQAKEYLYDFWGIPKNAVCYQENDIIYALEYLEQTSIRLNRPISFCIALGTSLSSHDGRSLLGYSVTLRSENLNHSMVIAGGNEGAAKRHYSGSVSPDVGFDKVELKVGKNEHNFTMQLWGDSPGLFAIDVQSPTGEYIPRMLPRQKEMWEITFLFEKTKIIIDYQPVEKQSGDQLIQLRFIDPAPGIWVFNVYGSGDQSLGFHIWLPMSNFITDETYFIRSDSFTTILTPGNSRGPITVTAYNTYNESLYLKASRGYTRTNIIKPDIAAPGVNIVAPTINQGFGEFSGTSTAAAHTAGVAAMILEWAIVKGNLPFIQTQDIKTLMIRGARRDPTLQYPNQDWGYGILDIFRVFESLRSR